MDITTPTVNSLEGLYFVAENVLPSRQLVGVDVFSGGGPPVTIGTALRAEGKTTPHDIHQSQMRHLALVNATFTTLIMAFSLKEGHDMID